MTPAKYGIVIHAGTSDVWNNDTPHQQQVEETLKNIAQVALAKLQFGSRALDVVQDAVMSLENCPLFNAGKGAVLNEDGEHEVI